MHDYYVNDFTIGLDGWTAHRMEENGCSTTIWNHICNIKDLKGDIIKVPAQEFALKFNEQGDLCLVNEVNNIKIVEAEEINIKLKTIIEKYNALKGSDPISLLVRQELESILKDSGVL